MEKFELPGEALIVVLIVLLVGVFSSFMHRIVSGVGSGGNPDQTLSRTNSKIESKSEQICRGNLKKTRSKNAFVYANSRNNDASTIGPAPDEVCVIGQDGSFAVVELNGKRGYVPLYYIDPRD